jgi:hypothetical protein
MYILKKTPDALFGTFWFSGLQSDIVQVSSRMQEVEEGVESKVVDFRDLLYANRNKQFTLTTNDDKIYTGVI